MKNTELTLAMVAANAPAFKATVTMEDIAPKTGAVSSSSDDCDTTMQALVRELPQEDPQVNYLWELYAAQERRKKNPLPAVKQDNGFDPLSVLAGMHR